MSSAGWLILLFPLISLSILMLWVKYTDYTIDKQREERQDDE